MITRKALIEKLEEMSTSEVVVKYGDYRNSHPLIASPIQRALAELIGAKKVDAREYTTKRGATKTSPAWLIELYKQMALLIYRGNDINVRTVKYILTH